VNSLCCPLLTPQMMGAMLLVFWPVTMNWSSIQVPFVGPSSCCMKQQYHVQFHITLYSLNLFIITQCKCFLGSIINDNNSMEERIVLGTKAYYANLKFFKSKLVTKYSKLKLYRSLIRPVVTNASETWVLKESSTINCWYSKGKSCGRYLVPREKTSYGELKPMMNWISWWNIKI